MEWVKANAAAVGVVDRVGQQVVNIHYHGSNKNQVGDLPPSAEHFMAEYFMAEHFIPEHFIPEHFMAEHFLSELLVTKQHANKQCGN